MAAAEVRMAVRADEILRVILGQHHAADVDLATADVGMDVDRAGHHHATGDVDHLLRLARVGRCLDDAAVAQVEVAHLAVDPVLGIVDATTFESRQHHRLSISRVSA